MNSIVINMPNTRDCSLPHCPGYHPETMRVCDPAAVACHDDFCPPDTDGAANPVLLFAPLLQGSTLLESVDLADVDGEYDAGSGR